MIKELLVPNLTYKVKRHDYSDIDDSYGTTDRDKLIINISSGLNLKVEQLTLLHEILHALELNAGIDKAPESAIEQFAHNLYYVLRNNPKLVEYLLK